MLTTPAVSRALVVGAFGGAALVLTSVYSRRAPLVFVPYAALLIALTWLLAQSPSAGFETRFGAALSSFAVASVALYVAVGVRAGLQRRHLVRTGRLPAGALAWRPPVWGHAWRLGVVFALGLVASLAVAFVSQS